MPALVRTAFSAAPVSAPSSVETGHPSTRVRRLLWLGSPQAVGRAHRHTPPQDGLPASLVHHLQDRGMEVDWWPLWPGARREWLQLDAVVLSLGHDNTLALQALRQMEAEWRVQAPDAASVLLPVVWMCAGDDVEEQIHAFEAGADLCLRWPLSERETGACLGALLRRMGRSPVVPSARQRSHGICRFGEWALDLATRRLTSPIGRVVVLTLAEFRLLRVFLSHPRQVLTRDTLLTQARGADIEVFDRSVDLVVSRLRTKLDDHPHQPRYIHTVRGVGYLFDAYGV